MMALSVPLRIERSPDGALERQRRAGWCKRELAASRLRGKCDYLDGTVVTSSPGRVP
jgi:hypothetical protein